MFDKICVHFLSIRNSEVYTIVLFSSRQAASSEPSVSAIRRRVLFSNFPCYTGWHDPPLACSKTTIPPKCELAVGIVPPGLVGMRRDIRHDVSSQLLGQSLNSWI